MSSLRSRPRPVLPRLLGLGLAAALALPAEATWSIVAVNRRTGEVAIGSATCILNEDLEVFVPVVVVGKGVGAAQSFVDPSGLDRQIMFQGFLQGLSSEEIFEDIVLNGSGALQTRQFGIVSMVGDAVTFSGTSNGAWAGGVLGVVGDIEYAIQGNVLVGELAVSEAERGFRDTNGDLSQRLMAGMEAAAAVGGDGRCSCRPVAPTSCGAPPPSFTKSAHPAFVIVARMGDVDGVCTGALGCSTGDYYLDISQQTGVGKVDPVTRVRLFYNAWRAGLAERPDHLRSTLTPAAESAPADGRTEVDFLVRLVDVDGVPLVGSVAELRVGTESGSSATASVERVLDHGDGSYTFTARAGTAPGTERFVVVADDGVAQATLYPFPALRVDPVTTLHAGLGQLSTTAGGRVPFGLNAPARPGGTYVLLASAAGTSPGQAFGGIVIPLNDDPFFQASLSGANGPFLPGSLGALDTGGRAEAAFAVPPGLLLAFVEAHLDWAAVFLGPDLGVSETVGVDLGL